MIQQKFTLKHQLDAHDLAFWQLFFQEFPSHYNLGTGALNNLYQEDFGHILHDYQQLKQTGSLTGIRRAGVYEGAYHDMEKSIGQLTKMVPQAQLEQHFLMFVYSMQVLSWNMKITPNFIEIHHLDSKKKAPDTPSNELVVQLAFISDLMQGRMGRIYPHLNLSPNALRGEIVFGVNRPSFCIEVNERQATLSSFDMGSKIEEFSFSFAPHGAVESPFAKNQSTLLAFIEQRYLEQALPSTSHDAKKLKI